MQEQKMKEKVRVRRESGTGEWGIPDRRGERVEARGLHSLQKRKSESETGFGASRNTHEQKKWRGARSTAAVEQLKHLTGQ